MKVRQTGITGREATTDERFDVDGYRLALSRYETLNRSLLATPVKPGFAWDTKLKRLVLRGEWADVPKRFLDLSERSEGYGNVDDRAHEFEALGIIDGDDLVRWMQTARRPLKSNFRFVYSFGNRHPGPSSGRMRAKRQRDQEAGLCIMCCKESAREKKRTCAWCSYSASVRVARAREERKALSAQLIEALAATV